METELPAGVREQEGLFDPVEQPPPVSLADRFVIPPFSVLDKRAGEWNKRRRARQAVEQYQEYPTYEIRQQRLAEVAEARQWVIDNK